jgi:hypothetical protein
MARGSVGLVALGIVGLFAVAVAVLLAALATGFMRPIEEEWDEGIG